MNGRPWSAKDLATLRELYANTKTSKIAAKLGRSVPALYGQAAKLGLEKSEIYLASADACRLRRGDQVGKAFRYPKGHVPVNKGTRRPGWFSGRMRDTQFRPGESRNRMPIGSTRIVDGYLYVKVAEVPHVAYTVNWKPVHVLAWEKANGRPLERFECLSFRDGNRLNCELENLELLTRAENMKRNTVHNLPKPIKRAIYAIGALNRRINREVKRGKNS